LLRLPDAVGQFLQRRLVAVDANHREPGGGQLLRRRPAPLAARADHDRHPLAHTATFSFSVMG
jgi:hypothetical protein